MEETTTPTPEYIKGFNEGYTLAKETPELAEKLTKTKSDGDRIQGFHDGRRQFVIEKVNEQRKDRIKSNHAEDKSAKKDRDIER